MAPCARLSPPLDPRSIRRPDGLGQTKTIRTPRSAVARLSASLFSTVWCRMERRDGPGRLYNIDNGNSYAGHLLELGPATIRVEGCAIGTCGGQNMTRIK